MSVEALTWAFEQDVPSGPKFLLVALANSADPYGVTYAGQALLAERCSVTRETVSRNMGALRDAGLIATVQRRRANGSRTSDWTILAPLAPIRAPLKDAPEEEFPGTVLELAKRGEDLSRAESASEENQADHVTKSGGPEPSVDPPAEVEEARALKIAGKPVKPELWDVTVAALGAFNAAVGKKLGATAGDGQPSETAKRIYGRVRAFPTLTADDHRRIVRNTLASKWWGDGPPSIGVVYGPAVFEDNMERPAPRGAPQAGDGDDPPRRRFTRED